MSQPTPPFRVLLVEDDDATRYAWRRWLEVAGYVVHDVSRVEQAMAALRDPFDVLVVDQKLPDGTGAELIQTADAQGVLKATSTIIVTAYDAPELDKGLHEGVLSKPVDNTELLRVVERRAREARQVQILHTGRARLRTE